MNQFVYTRFLFFKKNSVHVSVSSLSSSSVFYGQRVPKYGMNFCCCFFYLFRFNFQCSFSTHPHTHKQCWCHGVCVHESNLMTLWLICITIFFFILHSLGDNRSVVVVWFVGWLFTFVWWCYFTIWWWWTTTTTATTTTSGNWNQF